MKDVDGKKVKSCLIILASLVSEGLFNDLENRGLNACENVLICSEIYYLLHSIKTSSSSHLKLLCLISSIIYIVIIAIRESNKLTGEIAYEINSKWLNLIPINLNNPF